MIRHAFDFLGLDPQFVVELGVLESATSADSGARLLALASECFPSATNGVAAEETMVGLDRKMNSDVYAIVGTEAQAKVKSLYKLVA